MRDFILLHLREIQNILMTLCGLAVALGIAWVAPGFCGAIFRRVERALARISRNSVASIALVSGLSLAVCVLTYVVAGAPIPRLHDEFSYLLAGDTFAHGRLTNPPLPDAIYPYFETMHELMRPTYASKFGPSQGLFLALGEALFDRPWVGVCLSTILACAAVTWALFGWMRARWALLAGLLTAIHPQIVYWSHIYWGGAAGMLGGALVFGAIPRIMNRRRPIDAIVLVIGLAIVANARPYEALIWALAAGGTFLIWLAARARPRHVVELITLVVAAALTATPILIWMGYYNWRVTGDALKLPYQLHTETYMAVPLFYWNSPLPPKTYHNEALRHHHDVYERWYFESQQTARGWLRFFVAKVYKFWEQFLLRQLPLAAGFLVLPWIICRGWRLRAAGIYLLMFFAGWAIIPWFEHHYPAPIMALIMFLGISGSRYLSTLRCNKRRVGRAFVRWMAASSLLVLPPALLREYRNNHGGGWWIIRSQIESQLQSTPGRDLVIVRYGPQHVSGNEWVFNGADIKQSPVVWARELPGGMKPLLHYFPDRHAWLLNVAADNQPPVLSDYP
jgi:hypothetical protein